MRQDGKKRGDEASKIEIDRKSKIQRKWERERERERERKCDGEREGGSDGERERERERTPCRHKQSRGWVNLAESTLNQNSAVDFLGISDSPLCHFSSSSQKILFFKDWLYSLPYVRLSSLLTPFTVRSFTIPECSVAAYTWDFYRGRSVGGPWEVRVESEWTWPSADLASSQYSRLE